MKPKHFFEPDVFRGVAILLVISVHLSLSSLASSNTKGIWGTINFLSLTSHLGSCGVALFFVLSGFCIHISFLNARGFSTKEFFWRRLWRICPAYFVSLGVFYLLTFRHALFAPDALKQLFTHAFLAHNLSTQYFFGINPAFWSIGVEMQLYMLYPIILLVRSKFGFGACLFITFAVGVAFRLMVLLFCGVPDLVLNANLFVSPLSTWFDWTLGAFLAEHAARGQNGFKWHSIWILALIPALFVTISVDGLFPYTFLAESMISAVCLDWAIGQGLPKNGFFKAIGFVGIISYSLYLWHEPLIYWLEWHFRFLPPWADWFCVFSSIFLIAILSYQFIERPGIRIGASLWERFIKNRVNLRRARRGLIKSG